MGSHKPDLEQPATEIRETIGICAVCGEWIHDDVRYVTRPDGFVMHQACVKRRRVEAPTPADDAAR